MNVQRKVLILAVHLEPITDCADNTDGSYKCGCESGYQGDGTVSGTGCTGMIQ